MSLKGLRVYFLSKVQYRQLLPVNCLDKAFKFPELNGPWRGWIKVLLHCVHWLWLFTCVSKEVRGQTPLVAKRPVTLCTLIWPFTCVSTEMLGQNTRVVKRPVTLWTLIWLFTCVSTEMLGQITRVGKRLVTLCTLIWLFTCVSTEVRGQMVQHVKHLVTMYTLIWFFPCVSIGESVMITNCFFLLDVLMRLSLWIYTHVNLEIVHRCKSLVTFFAVPCSVCCASQAVIFHMSLHKV